MNSEPYSVLEVRDLKKHFRLNPGLVGSLMGKKEMLLKAVDGVSFSVKRGEVLGLVGESGCGKTTTAMTAIKLYEPTSGSIHFLGRDVADFSKAEMLDFRSKAQMVFQDPYQSLNPRFTIYDSVVEPLLIHGIKNAEEQRSRVSAALVSVRLDPSKFLSAFPHQLSGGERQRVVIARALTLQPQLLVADEPVSMLDVSVRAGVIDLVRSLVEERELAAICISHDLSNQRYLTDRLAVMYLGRIVEIGPTENIVQNPVHPYARALLAAVPLPDPKSRRERSVLPGEVPDSVDLPPGCRFSARCPECRSECCQIEPELVPVAADHLVSCWRYE
jgi:peptide/nickel transport system ATP-binding protein